jgi:ribose transport system substrate-binding protein
VRRVRIGVSEKNRDPYWALVNRGLHDAASRCGAEVVILAPADEDVDAQVAQIHELLAKGVDALAVVATQPDRVGSAIDAAVAAGVPVMCFDLDAPASRRLAYVGTEGYETLGRHAARTMSTRLAPASKVLVQVGSRHATGALGKAAGFRDEIEAQGHAVVEVTYDDHDPQRAQAQAATAIARHPTLGGMFGVYGYHPAAQAAAIAAAGPPSPPVIVGFDLLPETVHGLRIGTIAATLWIQEYAFGYYAAAMLNYVVRLGVRETLTMFGFDAEEHARNILSLRAVVVTRVELDDVLARVPWSAVYGEPA